MTHDKIQADIASIKRSRMFLVIFVLLFVCVILWTLVTLFNSQKESAISPELEQSAVPLTPTINESVLEQLEQEREFTDEELAEFPIYRFVKAGDTGGEVLLPLGEEPPETAARASSPTRATPTPRPSATPAASLQPNTTPAPASTFAPGNTLGVTTESEETQDPDLAQPEEAFEN
jgi:hypothetical protein